MLWPTYLIAPEEVIIMYIAGYLFLLASLAITVIFLSHHTAHPEHSTALATQMVQGRTRWAFIFFILAAAGLPPFFFFGCKLGLLTALVAAGSWGALTVVSLFILVSWAAYFNITFRLLSPINTTTNQPIYRSSLSPCAATVIVTLLLVCFGGLLIFEDAYILACWLANT